MDSSLHGDVFVYDDVVVALISAVDDDTATDVIDDWNNRTIVMAMGILERRQAFIVWRNSRWSSWVG